VSGEVGNDGKENGVEEGIDAAVMEVDIEGLLGTCWQEKMRALLTMVLRKFSKIR